MFEIEWANADFILGNLCCFSEQIMEQLYQKSLLCKKGTYFLTTGKRLPHAEKVKPEEPIVDENLEWEHILAVKLQMSWGASVFNL